MPNISSFQILRLKLILKRKRLTISVNLSSYIIFKCHINLGTQIKLKKIASLVNFEFE